MDKLREYLNSMMVEEQVEYAKLSGTSLGYLRKAISIRQRLGEGLCINLERESGGYIRCEELRPDVDWAFLRGSRLDDFSKVVI